MNSIFLFDIDGTLIHCRGAGRRAIERALRDFLSLEDIVMNFPFDGMTDRAILRLAVEAHGHSSTEDSIDDLIEGYVNYLAEEVARSSYTVLPGVVDVLNQLVDLPDIGLGLGTGNAEEGARIKLERGGLNSYFRFGGYGCANEDRAKVLHQGALRGAALLGRSLKNCDVVVIGDTIKDIAAARAIGARSLAVATGSASVNDLAVANPDLIVENLEDAQALEFLLS